MKYALALILAGCAGSPPPAPTAAPATAASVASAPSAPAAPATEAPATEPPPPPVVYRCTVYIMGGTQTKTRATIKDNAFQAEETTASEMSVAGKTLRGDAPKRAELCLAFARRKCPAEAHGDAARCRFQETEGDTADWGAAAPVPK